MSELPMIVYCEMAVTDETSTGERVEEYSSVGSGLTEMRRTWMESEDGPQVLLLRSMAGTGTVIATLIRDHADVEICHTLFNDGEVQHHRCHYLTADDGYYGGTVITPVREGFVGDWVASADPQYLLRDGCTLVDGKVIVDEAHRIVSRFADGCTTPVYEMRG